MNQVSVDAWREQFERINSLFVKYCDAVPSFADEEDIHQARVNGRKLLTLFSALNMKGDHPLISCMKEIMKLLGRLRDLDVMILDLEARLKKEEGDGGVNEVYRAFQSLLQEERESRRIAVSSQLPELVFSRFHDLFLQFLRSEMEERVGHSHVPEFVKYLEQRYNRRFKTFIDSEKKAGVADPKTLEALHRLRLSVKNLRYTVSDLKFAFPADEGVRLKSLKKQQKTLGEINDLHNRMQRWKESKPIFKEKGLLEPYRTVKREMKRELTKRLEEFPMDDFARM